MATRNLVLTDEEWRALTILVNNAEYDADQARLTARIDSPQEKAHLAEQVFYQGLQTKLAGRESVTRAS